MSDSTQVGIAVFTAAHRLLVAVQGWSRWLVFLLTSSAKVPLPSPESGAGFVWGGPPRGQRLTWGARVRLISRDARSVAPGSHAWRSVGSPSHGATPTASATAPARAAIFFPTS